MQHLPTSRFHYSIDLNSLEFGEITHSQRNNTDYTESAHTLGFFILSVCVSVVRADLAIDLFHRNKSLINFALWNKSSTCGNAKR